MKTFSKFSQGREGAAWLASVSFPDIFNVMRGKTAASPTLSAGARWLYVLLLQCCPRFLLASSDGLSAELPLNGKLVVKRLRTSKLVYELFV